MYRSMEPNWWSLDSRNQPLVHCLATNLALKIRSLKCEPSIFITSSFDLSIQRYTIFTNEWTLLIFLVLFCYCLFFFLNSTKKEGNIIIHESPNISAFLVDEVIKTVFGEITLHVFACDNITQNKILPQTYATFSFQIHARIRSFCEQRSWCSTCFCCRECKIF